ncbi:hypothetical protein FSP39_015570 [Pinctada imbricata]|uniref:Exonuclease domain-containing protein n=1 Tax=Pinctada imbricata TaxID=66713 RepID=A0AA88XKF6_PINIB|nr:hypothetical protein FSP39_015570 [Pinctada imbricata]
MAPTKPIGIGATKATGLTFKDGILRLRGKQLTTVTAKEGLEKFIAFIKAFKSPLVIGHNIQNFDLPVLRYHLEKHQLLDELRASVKGYVDTLKMARKLIPKADVGSYRQENLVKVFLGKTYEAHNALADVTSLQELFEQKLGANSKDLADNVFQLSFYSVKSSLKPLLRKKVISIRTMKKLAQNLFSLAKLRRIHARDPQNGIRNAFSEAVDAESNTPRISKSSIVINKLVKYLNSEE